MSNTFGRIFRATTFGESHGPRVGVVIDGCPAGMQLDFSKIQKQINRRRPGQNSFSSPRQESDVIECFSGLNAQHQTLGSPITLSVKNQDARPSEYDSFKDVYRPSHADFTTYAKYGIRADSGGGRASARETVGRVAAGAVAEQMLEDFFPEIRIVSWVDSIGSIQANYAQHSQVAKLSREKIDTSELRCPLVEAEKQMLLLIDEAQKQGDSLGGIIGTMIWGAPAGWGDPVFDKLEATLAHAMLSIPATKGFEIGSGFAGTKMRGSEHNDEFYVDNQKIRTRTNFSGGVQGGISNGEPIYFQVAFKPVATIKKNQQTVNHNTQMQTLPGNGGRHDACVLPRAVPIVEAMAALVLADHFLMQQSTQATLKGQK